MELTPQPNSRFTISKIEFGTESEGPDYFTTGEFQVTDTDTGDIVARFPWTLDEPYLTNKFYSGPQDVRISEDGTEAIAREGMGEETRILLPVAWQRIDVDGIELTPATDFAALARKIAAEDGPPRPDLNGWREPAGQWLAKLWRRLGKTPQASALRAAVEGFTSSADPRERAAAERFLQLAGP